MLKRNPKDRVPRPARVTVDADTAERLRRLHTKTKRSYESIIYQGVCLYEAYLGMNIAAASRVLNARKRGGPVELVGRSVRRFKRRL